MKMHASSDIFVFGELRLDRAGGGLFRRGDHGAFVPVAIGSRALDLLAALIERRGDVVSKEELMAAVWPKMAVEEGNLFVQISTLRAILDGEGSGQSCIQTVTGRGYRFVGSVTRCAEGLDSHTSPGSHEDTRPFPLGDGQPAVPLAGARAPEPQPSANSSAEPFAESMPAEAKTAENRSDSKKRSPLALAGVGIAALLALVGAGVGDFLVFHRSSTVASNAPPPLAGAPRLSIVVLPFENMSGDPEQDYFAEGVTDDLTTDLSHLPESFVISRGTAFTYKGKPLDAKQLGRELSVRYVLEGSMRRIGDKIAVNAQLISTETGAHVWADRFEGERDKFGELQVEFVARLANSLGVELVQAESLRAVRERPNNPDAVDLAMRGWAVVNPTDSKQRFNDGQALFERALSLDPQNIQAMTGLASVLLWRMSDGWSDNFPRDLGRAQGLIKRAIVLQPENSMLRASNAITLSFKGQWRSAIAEAETAIAYDRNNALAHQLAGHLKQWLGRSEDGIAGVETALRLSPHDGGVPLWQSYLCRGYSLLGRWEQAIEWCDKSVAGDPELTDPLIDLAAANAWAGHDKEAKDAVASLQKAFPGITVQKIWPADQSTDDPTFKTQWARIVEGLRKAGLPDEPTTVMAHLARADSLNNARQPKAALAEVEAVIAEDDNNAKAYADAGYYKMYLGRSEEGVADVETAFRLDPSNKEAPRWLTRLCFLHTKLAHWEQGIEWCEKALVADTAAKSWVLGNLAGAYAWAGRDTEAKEAVVRLHGVDPNFTVQTYVTNADFYDDPTFRAQAARLAEGMRKAGVPEE
jgi:TolB-like protein/DNA-binding winged helix-turn-helix (wHTH) protein/tetratricopeptide (TPR) repeat protein